MDIPQLRRKYFEAELRRVLPTPSYIRVGGLVLGAVVVLVFGRLPFVLGVAVQAVYYRRLPAWIGVPVAAGFFAFCGVLLQGGSFLTTDGAGSHRALALVCFIGFFFLGAAFFRGWRYHRFGQPPGWFMIRSRWEWDIRQQWAWDEKQREWHGEVADAVFENVGFHPVEDLNPQAIVARGGDPYGAFRLLKCPKCGHPLLFDHEFDLVYLDLADFHNPVSGPTSEEPVPCPECGFSITFDDIAGAIHVPVRHKEWLFTPAEIEQRGLEWIRRVEKAGS
jgi:hypothetical protein